MNNKKLTGLSLSNDETYSRKNLADLLPLDTPLGIDFYPSTFCNIRCIYCMQSSENSSYDFVKNKLMDLEVFKNTIDCMKNFPNKIKTIHFCGLGEPLMNKNLAQMIKYTKESNVAEKTDINTNGILFNKDLTDSIINAGIDFIRISVNGLCSQDFKKYSDANVDFEKYIENLTYLFENRKNTKIYIKILNFVVDTEEKKENFYRIFEPICDFISIENYNEFFEETKGKNQLTDTHLSQRGEKLNGQNCCPQPFFKMEILPDGNVLPCCEVRLPIVIGNINKDSIVDIWNSKIANEFRLKILEKSNCANEVCINCSIAKFCNFSTDNIDSERERLTEYYKNKI